MTTEPSLSALPSASPLTGEALPLGAPQVVAGEPAAPSAGALASAANPAQAVDARLGEVNVLLNGLEAPSPPAESVFDSAELRLENQLVQVRLGVASSLFAALRAKHAPTAHHSLRVALGCSAWGAMLGLSESERDELEVAALLHDVGKIGVPDEILLKPARLTP
jgi:HD-GYP domain-containing protein (c-di-GMP phosphodiesterase class II)